MAGPLTKAPLALRFLSRTNPAHQDLSAPPIQPIRRGLSRRAFGAGGERIMTIVRSLILLSYHAKAVLGLASLVAWLVVAATVNAQDHGVSPFMRAQVRSMAQVAEELAESETADEEGALADASVI